MRFCCGISGARKYALFGFLIIDDRAAITSIKRLWGSVPTIHPDMSTAKTMSDAVPRGVS
jgi:hypothetical protein